MLDRERLTKTLTSIKEFKAKDEFDNFTSNQTIVGFLLYLCRVDPSEKITHQCSLLTTTVYRYIRPMRCVNS